MTDSHASVTAPSERLEPPQDSEITTRNRYTRFLSVFVTALLSFSLPTIFGILIGSIFGSGGAWLLGLAGFGVGGWFLGKISKRLFVYNEELRAYVTNDPFTGQNVPYGSKINLSHPWEQRNKDDEYDLQVKNVDFELPVQTEDSNVIVEGSFQYRIDLSNITTYIAVNPGTIEGALVAFIKTFLTSTLAGYSLEEARKNIVDINAKLKEKFVSASEADDLQLKNGIKTVNLFLTTFKLPPQVQETRNSVDEAKQLAIVVATLANMTPEDYAQARKDGKITHQQHKELLDRAMAVSNNKSSINVNVIEGGNGKVMPMLPLKNNP